MPWCKKCFSTRFWHPKKHRHKKANDSRVSVNEGNTKYVREQTKKNLLQKLIDLAHISILFSTPMMAENYWLENEHIEIDRLLHLLAVTFLFILFDFFRLLSLPSLRVLLFRDTDGMKRRFVVKINRKSINLLRDCYTCLLLHDGATSAK